MSVAVITYTWVMGRWEPRARERLQAAALELFTTRGFEQTTSTEIAEAVGLTERTFFRHFADKREVLFYGQDEFMRTFVDAVDRAAEPESPMVMVAAAVQAGAALFGEDRKEHVRVRQSVIDANPALQERERHKLAGLAREMASALRARGIADPGATLAGESCVTVFAVAFARWLADGETRSLPEIAADVLDAFAMLSRPGQSPTPARRQRRQAHDVAEHGTERWVP